jgi:hypothetical protein
MVEDSGTREERIMKGNLSMKLEKKLAYRMSEE